MKGFLICLFCFLVVVDGDATSGSKLNPCTYCEYCTFCDECRMCPCKTSRHLPNCKYCKYCPLCSVACSGFCKNVCPTISSWVGSLIEYLPTSVHSIVSTDEVPSHEDIKSGIRETEQAHKLKEDL